MVTEKFERLSVEVSESGTIRAEYAAVTRSMESDQDALIRAIAGRMEQNQQARRHREALARLWMA